MRRSERSVANLAERRDRQGQCDGKRGYETKAVARDVKKRAARDYGKAMDAYRCPHCLRWHIGTRPKQKKASQ